MNDRRRTGVNRVVIDDGNGGKREVINVTGTWGKMQTILGVFIAIGTILGGVFVAARIGVNIEVKDAIEVEAEDEQGIIHQQMHVVAQEAIEEVQGVIQDDLDIFEGELMEQHDLGIRLEERQIAIGKDLDEKHQAVMTELRAIKDGGSN